VGTETREAQLMRLHRTCGEAGYDTLPSASMHPSPLLKHACNTHPTAAAHRNLLAAPGGGMIGEHAARRQAAHALRAHQPGENPSAHNRYR
jgi:hypothetical protein